MLVIRPIKGFEQPDYEIVWKEEGREKYVGRIYGSHKIRSGGRYAWFWSVDFFQRKGRSEPHQGVTDTEEEAKAAWKRGWESADVPINW